MSFFLDQVLRYTWVLSCSCVCQSKYIVSNHSPVHASVARNRLSNPVYLVFSEFLLTLLLFLLSLHLCPLLALSCSWLTKEIVHNLLGNRSMINLLLWFNPNHLRYFFVLNLREIWVGQAVKRCVTFYWFNVRSYMNIVLCD